ncbi:MAG TPA: glycosyltransferase family 4 protein [Gemmatimonadales bacterium]|nr:glycosyltransferase family 4 protein [Gemmatimonadales bacterium]
MRPSVLVAYDFPPARGGVARVMGEMARRYPSGTLVVSTGRVPSSRADGMLDDVEIDRVPLPVRQLRVVPGLLLWGRRVASLVRARDAGFVWAGSLKPAAYVARWARERTGVPYGILVYGNDLLAVQHRIHRSPIQRATVAALLRSAAVLVAVSEWTRDQARALTGELGVDVPIRVVPLGADPAHFHPGVDAAPVRLRHGMADGTWLLTVGASAPHKGVDTVFRALAELKKGRPALRYAVAGARQHTEALRRLADAHGVADRVVFIPDVAEAELPGLYRAADLYLGVSRRDGRSVEGFGIALAEASASGLSVIAGRSGGIPELVRDGETGVLVDPERTGPLVEAIERLLDKPQLARRLADAGRAEVERYYNWDRVVGDLKGIEEEFGRQS